MERYARIRPASEVESKTHLAIHLAHLVRGE